MHYVSLLLTGVFQRISYERYVWLVCGSFHTFLQLRFSYSDIDWDGIETWIDSIGSPFMDAYLPDEVENIIEEEISAFLAGACTAETAAKIIDSRVSLYLEESK